MKTIVSTLVIGYAACVFAQNDVVIRAMRDEIKRNMDHLVKDDNKPYYISYGMSTTRITQLYSMFGSLIREHIDTVRSWNARVMVGDYQINDENFSDNQKPEFNYFQYPPVPKEDDYNAIRRFFWITTNNIFEEANRLYNSKIESIEKYDINYEVPDFDTTEIVQMYIPLDTEQADHKELKNFVMELSEYVSSLGTLFAGNVTYNDQMGIIQFINSEGIEYSIPRVSASLSVQMEKLNRNGQMLSLRQNFDFETGTEILNQKSNIMSAVKDLHSKMEKHEELELEDYYGPVWVKEDFVAQFFGGVLMSKLQTNRDILSVVTKEAVKTYFKNLLKENTREEWIGNKDMNVTAYPKWKEYEGKKLIGSILIDGEGVVPPDSLQLVKNGKIITKFNGRTPAPKALRSNGHNKNVLYGGNLQKSISPSNLMIEFNETVDIKSMEDQFIEQIKDQGLDFGLIIEPAFDSGLSMMKLTKLFLNGTREEFITSPVDIYDSNMLRKIVAVQNELDVFNSASEIYGVAEYSLICPKSILFKDYIYTRNLGRNQPYFPSIPMPYRH